MTDFIPFADASADGVVDDDVDYAEDDIPRFHERLAVLRAEKGAARLRFGPTTGWVLLRYADCASAVKDEARFSKSEAFRPVTFPFMGPNIQGYDGHEHTVKRALVSPAFRRTVIPEYVEPIFRPIAEELVDEFAALGKADLMETFAKKYPMRITNRLLGIPAEDEEQMAAWAVAMLNILADPEGSIRANAEFTEYVRPLLDERRKHPKDDVLSALVTEEVEGQQLSEDEVLGFLRLLFPAGVDTTWLTLGSMLYAVMLHPEVRDRLLSDETERSWAVEETLRWEASVCTEPRVTLQDVSVAGNTISCWPTGTARPAERQQRPRRLRRPHPLGPRPTPDQPHRLRSRTSSLPGSEFGARRTHFRA